MEHLTVLLFIGTRRASRTKNQNSNLALYYSLWYTFFFHGLLEAAGRSPKSSVLGAVRPLGAFTWARIVHAGIEQEKLLASKNNVRLLNE